jgi:hypothetical protein
VELREMGMKGLVWGDEKHINNLDGKREGKIALGKSRRISIYYVKIWVGFNWLRIGTSGRLL